MVFIFLALLSSGGYEVACRKIKVRQYYRTLVVLQVKKNQFWCKFYLTFRRTLQSIELRCLKTVKRKSIEISENTKS